MASKAPGKAPAKPKPGAAKARPVVKQLTPEEKQAAEIKEAFAVWDQGIYLSRVSMKFMSILS